MKSSSRLCVLLLCVLPIVLPSASVVAAPIDAADSWDILLARDDLAGAAPTFAGGVNSIPVGTVRPKAAEISVRYHSVPSEGQVAVEAAMANWERQFASNAETIVDVTWASELEAGLLGRVKFRGFVKDDADDAKLPTAGVIYPSALANAIRGNRVDSEPDIVIELNSKVAWYYGTDGRPPAEKHDLVTVAMHEFGQGLGFSSRLDLVGGKVEARSGMLSIYDTFLVNYRGQSFSAILAQDNASLAASITGGDAYFSGANARSSAGKAPKLHAPAAWEQGSSLSHLDPQEYGVPDVNGLLAPGLEQGWAMQDPGPIALAMMRDMGWTIAGLGQPARVAIARLPSAIRNGPASSFSISTSIQDPVGALVTSDNSTVVTVGAYYSPTIFGWGCIGETSGSKVVANGRTSWRGCYTVGKGVFFVVAQAPDLARGTSNIVIAAVSINTVAMLTRDP